MKRMFPAARNVDQAFTLIEMLVVIAIIGILAGMLLPALGKTKTNAQKKVCQSEEANLVAAINQYYAQYSRLPASTGAVNAANSETAANGNSNDFTFGTVSNVNGFRSTWSNSILPSPVPPNLPTISTVGESGTSYQNFNSEVIAILRDDNFWPEASNNSAHIYNPQQTQFFNAKLASDQTSPGIGTNDVFLDPWGCPYIVTLDLNYDGKCFDYTLNQMYQYNSPTPSGPLMIPGVAVVWSFGPYKTISTTNALNTGFNHQTVVTSF